MEGEENKQSTEQYVGEEQPAQTQTPQIAKQLGFKSSQLPQSEELKKYLQSQLYGDPYNKFCVDCHRGQSTHAALTYGIFICASCAQVHQATFAGRSRSQIKDVFGEQWDDYQLEAIAPGVGGNKAFYTFLQEYEGLAGQPIEKKYRSDQVSWYVRRIAAHLDQRAFTEKQPAKDWDERFERAKQSMKSLINKTEMKLVSVTVSKDGAAPAKRKESEPAVVEEGKGEDAKEESGEPKAPESAPSSSGVSALTVVENKTKDWSNKIKGFFKEKLSKASKPAASASQNDAQPAEQPASEQQPEAKPDQAPNSSQAEEAPPQVPEQQPEGREVPEPEKQDNAQEVAAQGE